MKIRRIAEVAFMVLTRSRVASGLATSSANKEPTRKAPPAKAKSAPKKRALLQTNAGQDISGIPSDSNARPSTYCSKDCLFALPDDLVRGILRNRPSKRNRSPYVADVYLETDDREAICHVPNLDMGGKCVPGVTLLMKPARDKKGNIIGKDALSPKYGTPKCEFIAQLLHVDESTMGYEPTWVGAHPTLGETIAEQLVARNLLGPDFPRVKSFQREVRNVGGADMRADFVIEHEDPNIPPRILEVKTVVDTDYSTSATPERAKCVFTSDRDPYVRTAIFPWGRCNQKGPDGEKVVSARAIKHVRELTRLRQTRKFDATVLFVVIRNDARAFRPNYEACPSFARYITEAEEAGVQVLAKQVLWGEGIDMGKCFEGPLLDIDWPKIDL
jgi:DNA-binding sugar fermentation-stimulating protein